jgi:hypothetical protein
MLRGRDQTERDHTALVKGRAVGRADPRGTRAAQAPAVGMPMLVLLALALSVGPRTCCGAKRRVRPPDWLSWLRRPFWPASPIPPIPSVVVSRDQCKIRTTQTWDATAAAVLDNQCSNALLIEAIDTECGAGEIPALALALSVGVWPVAPRATCPCAPR